jgi:ABC-type transporter Mla subunit MlaD
MPDQTRRKEFKAGLLVLFVAAAAVGSLVWLGLRKDLFADRVYYYVNSASSERVEPGMPVKLSGFRIGQVSGLAIFDVDHIRIELKVLEKPMHLLTRGTEVTLAGGFPFGAAYINVIPGPEDAPPLSPGATLELAPREDILATVQDDIGPIMVDVRAAVANLRALSEQAVAPEGPVQTLLADLNRLAEAVASGESLLGMLAVDPDPARRLRSMLRDGEALMANLNTLSAKAVVGIEDLDELQAEVRRLMVSLQGFMRSLTSISRQLEPAVADISAITGEMRNATRDLTRLRHQGERTLRLGVETLERLQQTWPLARPLPERPQPSYPVP